MSRALTSAFESPRFKYPALAMLILAIIVLFYYVPVTHRNAALLNDRAFRSLASIADQLQSRVDVFSSVMGQTALIQPSENRAAYLTEQVPDLEYVNCAETPTSANHLLPERISLARWSKAAGIDFVFRYHPGPTVRRNDQADSCAVVPLQRLVGPLVPGGMFDELVFADEDGTVLFSTDRSGTRITNISSLFAEQNPGAAHESGSGSGQQAASQRRQNTTDETHEANSTPPQPGRDSAFAERRAASNVFAVQFAGAAYQAFLVPVPLRLARPDLAAAGSRGASFVLCGLMTQGNYQTAINAVSGPAIIVIVLLILAIVVGNWPILKFTQMRTTETIPRRTAVRYAVMTVCAITFLVMLVIHVSYLFRDPHTDYQLDQLSRAIEGNFGNEVQRSLAMLNAVERSTQFQNAPAGRVAPSAICSPDTKHADPAPASWQGKVLTANLPLTEYPYFDHLFWADRAGYQEIKWSTRNTPTPDKNLCGYPFFEEPIHQQLWRFATQGTSGTRFRVDPVLSPNTGRYVAVITQAIEKPDRGRALSVAAVVSPLMSLVDPVLPPEYGFAVVDPSGLVLFQFPERKER